MMTEVLPAADVNKQLHRPAQKKNLHILKACNQLSRGLEYF